MIRIWLKFWNSDQRYLDRNNSQISSKLRFTKLIGAAENVNTLLFPSIPIFHFHSVHFPETPVSIQKTSWSYGKVHRCRRSNSDSIPDDAYFWFLFLFVLLLFMILLSFVILHSHVKSVIFSPLQSISFRSIQCACDCDCECPVVKESQFSIFSVKMNSKGKAIKWTAMNWMIERMSIFEIEWCHFWTGSKSSHFVTVFNVSSIHQLINLVFPEFQNEWNDWTTLNNSKWLKIMSP
jgi:hypothetical protein